MNKTKVTRIKISTYTDRMDMVRALANAGHKVWVEEADTFPHGTNYYICFENEGTSEIIEK